jgi:predicted dehydrogenase
MSEFTNNSSGPAWSSPAQSAGDRPVRLGFVGLGGRGSYHLDCALGFEGVEVPALCEIQDDRLQQAKSWVEDSGRPTPRLYGRGETDFERMCAEEELDAVICCTSWKWHTPVCLAANRSDKHAVCEVPIVLTLDEAWELIETCEKTGKWSTLGLEQALLEPAGGLFLNLLNLIRTGMLGDIVHASGGYIHDLRQVKFPGGGEPWRLEHSIKRNGDLYPDHPMNLIMPYMDINHGDRFTSLVSMSARSGILNDYAVETLGKNHALATTKMNQGDYNATLLQTEKGKVVTLNFDTNTPHPRGLYRIQGTKGVFIAGSSVEEPMIYLDGISPESHQWEPAGPYLEDCKHPVLKGYNPTERKSVRGHGGGSGKTPLTWHLLVRDLREGNTPYFDVYDSVTSSVISPLSEMSVANRSQLVEFPDFTRGKWKTRKPFDVS